jgi:beta-alanine--pyruvate transaminase
LPFPTQGEADSVAATPTPQKAKEAPMLDKSPNRPAVNVPNDLAAHWMPFTANRAFKKNPRLLAGAKDMHYITVDGRNIIDGAAGMWCCNAGHGRSQIAEAIGKQAADLDYAPPFQFGIPQAFELASRIADLAPDGLDHVFFCNSGSEAADTALKIALTTARSRPSARASRSTARISPTTSSGWSICTALTPSPP